MTTDKCDAALSFVTLAIGPDGKHDRLALHPENEQEGSWSDLVECLSVHAVGDKYGCAFIPVRFAWSGQEWIRRLKANVTGAAPFVVLDSDGLTSDQAQRLWEVIQECKIDAIAYSSWSYRLKPGCRFRLAMRLDREQSVDEIVMVRKGCAQVFGQAIGVSPDQVFDCRAMDAARLFHEPRRAPDRESFIWRNDGGQALCVDLLVEAVPLRVRCAAAKANAASRKRVELGLEGAAVGDADDAHRVAAAQELAAFCDRVERHGGLFGLGELLEFQAKLFGQYTAAGALTISAVVEAFEGCLGKLAAKHGADAEWVRTQTARVRDVAIPRGEGEGPALPAVTDADRDAIERAEDEAFGRAGGAAELQQRLVVRLPEQSVSLSEAGRLMRSALKEGAIGGKGLLLQVTAGAGKSFTAARVISDLAKQMAKQKRKVVYVTQEHAVLRDVRAKLDQDVTSTHLSSPLREEDVGAPRCPLPAKKRESLLAMIGQGYSRASVCVACAERETCDASRYNPKSADVVFATFGDIDRAMGLAGRNAVVIVDEQPSLHERVSIARKRLVALRDSPRGGVWGEITRNQELAVRELARAWLAGEQPGPITRAAPQALAVGATDGKDAAELARKWRGCLDAAKHRPEDAPKLDAAMVAQLRDIREVLRIGAAVESPTLTDDGIDELVLTPLGQVLRDREHARIVMSATPIVSAFPPDDWKHVRVEVEDAPGVSITRRIVYRGRVGRRALCPGRVGKPDVVRRHVERVLHDHPEGSIMLCTYKPVADLLRGQLAGVFGGRDVVVTHYGAIRGKNEVNGRRVEDFDHYVSIGDPWTGGVDELAADAALAEDESRSELWQEHTEAELGQFHARARDVRRERPANHTHYGAAVPAGWHAGQDVEIEVADARVRGLADRERATEALEEAALWFGQARVADACGTTAAQVKNWTKRRTTPTEAAESCRALLAIDSTRSQFGPWMSRLAALPVTKRAWLREPLSPKKPMNPNGVTCQQNTESAALSS